MALNFMLEHSDAIIDALGQTAELPLYVAGAEIRGDALRAFSDSPILNPPLVCMLSPDAGFLSEEGYEVRGPRTGGPPRSRRATRSCWTTPRTTRAEGLLRRRP